MNKKILSVVMSCGMVVAAVTGCSNDKTAEVIPEPTNLPEQVAAVELLSTTQQNAILLNEESSRSMLYPINDEKFDKRVLLIRCDDSEEDRQAIALAKQISENIKVKCEEIRNSYSEVTDDNVREVMDEEQKVYDAEGIYLNIIVSSGTESRVDAVKELGLFEYHEYDWDWSSRIILSHEVIPGDDAFVQTSTFRDSIRKLDPLGNLNQSLYLNNNLSDEDLSDAAEAMIYCGEIFRIVYGSCPMIYASPRYNSQLRELVINKEPYRKADWWKWDDDGNPSVYAQSLRDFYNWEPSA